MTHTAWQTDREAQTSLEIHDQTNNEISDPAKTNSTKSPKPQDLLYSASARDRDRGGAQSGGEKSGSR